MEQPSVKRDVSLTDEVAQRCADEAEQGYDLDRITTRRRPPSEGSRRCMIYRITGE